MKGPFPLVFSRTSCPVSSSVLSISDSGYQKAQVPLGRCLSVIFTSSGLFTVAESCSSDRRSDFPLASTSKWNKKRTWCDLIYYNCRERSSGSLHRVTTGRSKINFYLRWHATMKAFLLLWIYLSHLKSEPFSSRSWLAFIYSF